MGEILAGLITLAIGLLLVSAFVVALLGSFLPRGEALPSRGRAERENARFLPRKKALYVAYVLRGPAVMERSGRA